MHNSETMDQRFSDYDTSRRDIPSFIEPRPPLIQNPFMRPRPQKGTNLLEQFEEDSETETELVQVYLRMKPCETNDLYRVTSDKTLVTSIDSTTTGNGKRLSRMYTFSHIFTAESSQKEIFEKVIKDNLKKLPDGQSFTLLTYGASGSGKTYTLMGTVSSPGLIPRSLEYVFKLVDAAQVPTYKPSDNGADQLGYAQQEYELQWVKRLRHLSAPLRDKYRRMSINLHNDLTASTFDLTNRTKYYVWVSFVEIYNEAIYDLLAPPERRTKLRIREDASGNVYVKDVTQAFVRSGEEAYDVMVAGKHNLVVAATGVHANSSRSHCIFTITLLTENEGELRTSHVRLCDLAGCERQRAARNKGVRMQESRSINSSLHVLERCLHMLRKKQRHMKDSLVPYRESKLTRLLGSGLSGSRGEAVSMVVTLNPSPQFSSETKHVLTLAGVAQSLQTNMTLYASTLSLESSTQDTTIACSAEVLKLRVDNERLHFELMQAQARNRELLASMEERQLQNAKEIREMVEEAKDMTRQYYESEIQRLTSKMEDMKEEYESQLESLESRTEEVSGTPTKHLQAKVKQLEKQIEYLEDELTKQTLARSRDQVELEHLRTCIEERDEADKESSTNKEELVELTDSEPENDDNTDHFNESLEPCFRRENQNRSRIHKIQPKLLETSKEQEKEEVVLTDSESECEDNTENFNETQKECRNETIEDNETKDNSAESCNDKLKDQSVKISDTEELLSTSNLRGTYFVSNEELQKQSSKDDHAMSNSVRGTYFVYNPVQDRHSEVDAKKDDGNVNEKVKESGAIKVAESFIGKIMQSMKVSQGSDSLTTFEQLEKAVTDTDGSKDQSTCFADVKMSKEKRTYFEDATKETAATNSVTNETNDDKEKCGNLKSDTGAIIKKRENTHYFRDKADDDKSSSLSVAAKLQEKLLYTDDVEKQSDSLSAKLQTQLEDKTDVCKTHVTTSTKAVDKQLYFDDNDKINTKDVLISSSCTKKSRVQENPCFVDKTTKDEIIHLPTISNKVDKNEYFDNNDKFSSNDIIISRSGTEKRQYFDNISVNLHSVANKKVNAIITNSLKHEERSPSIVKDDVGKDFVPSVAMKKLLGESYSKPNQLSSLHKNKAFAKKQESVDIFESPQINIAKAIEDMAPKVHTENATMKVEVSSAPLETKAKELSNFGLNLKFAEKSVLEQKLTVNRATEETKLDPTALDEESLIGNVLKNKNDIVTKVSNIDSNILLQKESTDIVPDTKTNSKCDEPKHKVKNEELVIEESKTNLKDEPKYTIDAKCTTIENSRDVTKENNTIDEFENICKDLSNVRATEFELLVTQEINTSNTDKLDKPLEKEPTEAKANQVKEISEKTRQFEETKYNLRHKGKSVFNVSDDKKGMEGEEILAESHSKCESKSKTVMKRSLRLRRRKNQDEDNSDQDNEKLKDIINLEKEFSDVTMGLPPTKMEVKDIPSPEKLQDADENVPPMYGIQSCPSKSVTRSRRKLFTPRAEPLEESLTQTGDSNERVYVPRPSYHRSRARRKL